MPRNCVSSGVQNYQASVSTVSFPVAFINNMRLNEDIPCPGASFSDAFIAVVTSSWAPLPLKGIFFFCANLEHRVGFMWEAGNSNLRGW